MKLLCFLLLSMGLPTCVHAQAPWTSLVKEIRSKADSGDADSQGIMSVFIQTKALGGTNEQAFVLAEKSANANSCFGFYALGRCYEFGIGTKKEENKAQEFFLKASPTLKELAESGNVIATNLLADCYNSGHGVRKNHIEAKNLYLKAADQKYPPAIYQLHKSTSQAMDNDKWQELRQRAAALGYAPAQYDLANNYTSMFNQELVTLCRKAAEQGHEAALMKLAYHCKLGGNYYDAVKWYRKAAEQGVANAQFFLAECYDNGKGVTRDEEEALKWYRKSAEQGLSASIDILKQIPSERALLEEAQANLMTKYLEIVKDENSSSASGPSKETIIKEMFDLCKRIEKSDSSSSLTIQRGNTLISNGFNNIPLGVELHPIRLSGSKSLYTLYFYQDEFGDWKTIEK